MPARSVAVTFHNETDSTLILNSTSISHGIWSVFPPATIEKDQVVEFGSESDGFATGTEAGVTYQLENLTTTVNISWDNPFVGSNSYSEGTSESIWHRIVREGSGSGDNASITWRLQETSSQRDGIPDDWKLNGVDIDDGSGTGTKVHVDLPGMGASINKPDIFVQLDWMADATHNHAISAAAIKTVVEAFRNSPYKSPTGAVGINLHIDAGPNSILDFSTGALWGTLSRAKQLAEVTNFGTTDASGNYVWTAFDTVKNAAGGFTRSGRTGIFHYCISMNQFSTFTNSGISRPAVNGGGGNDFIVSLGSFGSNPSDIQQAGTFMHELGHNLGLGHGGADTVNYKPNYLSIMNYLFQLVGLTQNGVPQICSYSTLALPDLDETALNEAAGLGPDAAGFVTQRWSAAAGAYVAVPDASKAIDWNDDGSFESTFTSYDVNHDNIIEGSSTSPGLLLGCNDWEILSLKSAAIGGGSGIAGGESVEVSAVEEMTKADLEIIQPVDTTPPVTTASLDPPPNARGWNNTAVTVTLTATDDLSGVVTTSYSVDGGALITAFTRDTRTVSFSVEGEGIHTVTFFSVDRGQNVEATQSLSIQIDLTPPEAEISYDPHDHQIIVRGTDALSGTYSGRLAPSTVQPSIWRVPGADIAETRTYRIEDYAGNSCDLVMHVRNIDNEYELNISEIKYHPTQSNNTRRPGERSTLQKNTIVFRRLLPSKCCDPAKSTELEKDNTCACGCEDNTSKRCILAVLQRLVVETGEQKDHTNPQVMVKGEWDIMHDESNVLIETLPETQQPKDGEKVPPKKEGLRRCVRLCGLWKLKVLTENGRLSIDMTKLESGLSASVEGEGARGLKGLV